MRLQAKFILPLLFVCGIALAVTVMHWPTAPASSAHAAQPHSSQIDWPQYAFDPQRTGYNPYEKTLGTSNVANLKLAWQYAATNDILTAPAISNGIIYFGSEIGRQLYAVNATTGALLWSKITGLSGGLIGAPIAANGLVYVGTGYNFHAYNAQTGADVWTAKKIGYQNTTPLLNNGVLYVSSNGKLYAFNATTGALIWQSNPGYVDTQSGMAFANNILYLVIRAPFGVDKLRAVNATNGATLWTVTDGQATSPPVVANSLVYFPDYTHQLVNAYNATTGSLVWSKVMTNGAPFNLAIANNVLYVWHGGALEALNATTGAPLWHLGIGHGYFTEIVLANGVIYLVDLPSNSSATEVLAVGVTNHKILWSHALDNGYAAGIAVVNATVYVTTGIGGKTAFAFNLP